MLTRNGIKTKIHGLPNVGNSCHMNAALQAIYSCDFFRKIFHPDEISDPKAMGHRDLMSVIMGSLTENKEADIEVVVKLSKELSKYAERYCRNGAAVDNRHDGDEDFFHLINLRFHINEGTENTYENEWNQQQGAEIEDRILSLEENNDRTFLLSLAQIYKTAIMTVRCCKNCNSELSMELSPIDAINLFVPENWTGGNKFELSDFFVQRVTEIKLNEAICNEIRIADQPKKGQSRKIQRIACSESKTCQDFESVISNPDILFFRFPFPKDLPIEVKIPEILSLADYRDLFPDIPPKSTFALRSVLCYIPLMVEDEEINHYVTYRRFLRDNEWYCFDDCKVKKSELEHLYPDPKLVIYERVTDDELLVPTTPRTSLIKKPKTSPNSSLKTPNSGGLSDILDKAPTLTLAASLTVGNFANARVSDDVKERSLNFCGRFFGENRDDWPYDPDDVSLRNLAMYFFALSKKWKVSTLSKSLIALKNSDGITLKSMDQIMDYISKRPDKDRLIRDFERMVSLFVRYIKRVRGINNDDDDRSGIGDRNADIDFEWDALKLSLDKKSVVLRGFRAETGKTDTMRVSTKRFLQDKLVPPAVKEKVKTMKPKDPLRSKWVSFNGDSSKHRLSGNKRSIEGHILASEQIRCAPYAFLDLLGLSDHFQRSFFRNTPANFLNNCSLAELSVHVKRRLNINLQKVSKEILPNETKKDFLLRQTTGKFLVADFNHVLSIDCSTGIINRGFGEKASLSDSFEFMCERAAEIRRIQEPGFPKVVRPQPGKSASASPMQPKSSKLEEISRHQHPSGGPSSYCVATLLHLSGLGEACCRLDCKFVHPTSREDVQAHRFNKLIRIKSLRLNDVKRKGLIRWMMSGNDKKMDEDLTMDGNKEN